MAEELKSFRKDWQRWSGVERATIIVILVLVVALVGAPVTISLL